MFHSDTYNTKICRYTSYNLSIIFSYFYTIHIPYKTSLCIVNVQILSRAIVYDRKRPILNKNDMRAFVHDRKRMILNKNDTRDVAFHRKKEKGKRKKQRNGGCCVLRDYHPKSVPLSRGEGEQRGSFAISAVRMPHARDPFRRRFEYPAGNNESPLFR